jgi:preprotein translocase subunit SecA
MLNLFRNMIPGSNERELRRLRRYVEAVGRHADRLLKVSDDELRASTARFREQLDRGAAMEDILPEAYAVVREVGARQVAMRAFDVQILGAVVLHEGNIAEMATGEGKTLVAAFPLYVNALAGRGAHLVTVNDYLARFHSEWMGKIYTFLGLSVGLIEHGMDPADRRRAYAADITYGTNNEFGFDYLRDNMALHPDHMVQRELRYAIVDEVDSILIDEARTPLIISGPSTRSADLYYKFARIVPKLRPEEDYVVDEKAHTVTPTEDGLRRVERLAGVDDLFAPEATDLNHYLNQALRAHALYRRDHHYIVKDGEVLIVDEFTGRLMFGRRYSDGLHQAIEAKEGARIQSEHQTLATITLQNYFRMYSKLAGMTGTAATEAEEFRRIYGLDVVKVPTNRPMIRVDHPDVVFRSDKGRTKAVIEEIERCNRTGQPVLVGTTSIERSERISTLLRQRGIQHEVLNAKHHEREAAIVALAGQRGAVTIATNMAGRGTDIVLGPGVVDLGGLYVLGTERHEARRIDNQLRGRCGRQGDPGESRFFVSLDDDLMRLFGTDSVTGLLDRLGMDDDMPLEHNLLSRALERAQKRVEGRNFDIRRRVLEYDDVLNQQRELVYKQRREVVQESNLKSVVQRMTRAAIERTVDLHAHPTLPPEDWNLGALAGLLEDLCLPRGRVRPDELAKAESRDGLVDHVAGAAAAVYAEREAAFGPELTRDLERLILLRVVDSKWMDHLDAMDDLREGVGLRAYGQKDPLLEYKFEAYEMFEAMIRAIEDEVTRLLFHVRVEGAPAGQHGQGSARTVSVSDSARREQSRQRLATANAGSGGGVRQPVRRRQPVAGGRAPGGDQASSTTTVTTATASARPGAPAGASADASGGASGGAPGFAGPKLGRNDPCPCGSGKKYKRCCGRDQA